MSLFRVSFFLALNLFALTSLAQPESGLDGDSRGRLQVVTSAVVALASADSVAAGTYKFKNSTGPDATLDLYKFVGEFPVGDRGRQFVPLVEISPSYSEVEQRFPDGGKASLDSWSVGAGAGLQMQFFDRALTIVPRFKVDYSKVEFDFTGTDSGGETLDELVPRIEAWTYLPSLEVGWIQQLGSDGSSLILNTRGTYLYVDAVTESDELADFSDESWVWRTRIAYEHPVKAGEKMGSLILRPSVGRVDVHGAARDGLELSDFYEFGIDILSREVAPQLLSEVGLGVTYVYEEEIQGWRFGVIGKLS